MYIKLQSLSMGILLYQIPWNLEILCSNTNPATLNCIAIIPLTPIKPHKFA